MGKDGSLCVLHILKLIMTEKIAPFSHSTILPPHPHPTFPLHPSYSIHLLHLSPFYWGSRYLRPVRYSRDDGRALTPDSCRVAVRCRSGCYSSSWRRVGPSQKGSWGGYEGRSRGSRQTNEDWGYLGKSIRRARCDLNTQPLFELGKNPLAGPIRTIRSFFRPLIQEALDRRSARKGAQVVEQEKMRLIDRLVDSTDGRPLILGDRRCQQLTDKTSSW